MKNWFKIDKEDLEKIKPFKWFNRRGYIMAHIYKNGKRTSLYMHRLIMNVPDGTEIDHIDGDGLDNRKKNLRFATRQQNAFNQPLNSFNTSGFKGVGWVKARKRWRAILCLNGRDIYLGIFKDKFDAARAYNKGATQYFGEYARLNII